jgi:putative ABC transport system permease protein
MTRLALRNLFHSKRSFLISIGGVTLSLVLVLSLDAIFAGVERQVTAYIDWSGADVFVSQDGVRNLHMTTSSLPGEAAEQVAQVDGVVEAVPILYLSNMIVTGQDRHLAYVIGLPPAAPMGGPWRVAEGEGSPGPGEAVIDRTVAAESGVSVGDEVEILGVRLRVVGLAEGTASLVNSVAFIAAQDFARIRGGGATASFLLVRAAGAASEVAARIEAEVPGVTALPRADFAAEERRVIHDMSTDVVTIMNLVGFLIGLAVMALSVYVTTLARRSEYGMLKALGATTSDLNRVVVAQALLSVGIGFVLAAVLTLGLTVAVPAFSASLSLRMSIASLAKVAALSLLISGVAALVPVRQIAGLDPAMVFRGK